MPFITNADYHTLARRLEDICFKSTPQGAQPQLQTLPKTSSSGSNGNVSNFQYYLSTREHCLKFVDLYTRASLMEVLQVDEESVREEMTSILEGETDLIPNKYEGGFKVWEGKVLWSWLMSFLCFPTNITGLFDLIEYIEKNQIIDETFASVEGTSHTGVNILDVSFYNVFHFHQTNLLSPFSHSSVAAQDFCQSTLPHRFVSSIPVVSFASTCKTTIKTSSSTLPFPMFYWMRSLKEWVQKLAGKDFQRKLWWPV